MYSGADVDLSIRLAYRAGVTTGVVAPLSRGLISGFSAAFVTGARHKLAPGALVQAAGAVHVSLHPGRAASVSTQIAALRHLLLGETKGEMKKALDQVKKVCTHSFLRDK